MTEPEPFYSPLLHDDPVVIAQLGQSLDGFIASRTGDACFVTGPEDHTHLHVLRSLVDAVVIGAATVVADDCRLTVRNAPVRDRQPTRVVLDPRGLVPGHMVLLRDGSAPTVWVVGQDAAPDLAGVGDHVEVVALPAADIRDPRRMVEALAERGLRRLLVEGGGRLVSSWLAAGVLDRIYVTTAPLLIGDGVPGLRFPGRDALADAVRGPSRRHRLGDDVCTEIVLRAARR